MGFEKRVLGIIVCSSSHSLPSPAFGIAAGLLDGAWTRRPAPPAAPICQEVVDSVPAKSSKTKAKSTKAAIGKKGVKEESMPTSEDDLPVALPVFQVNLMWPSAFVHRAPLAGAR